MTLLPKDRRGLGEIVTWASVMFVLGVVVVAYLFRGVEPPHELVIVLAGTATALIARGAQSAAERSGSSEQRDREALAMREAREELHQASQRLEMMTNRLLDKQIDMYLPAPPRPGDKT